jgi:transposase-like protein
MYSYEDRIRAVRLYIKLGKRAGLTIRQLGYPTKNSLKSWHKEFVQRADLTAGYVRQPKFTDAQKKVAVDHYFEHGRCLALTVKALGYPSKTLLSIWVRERDPSSRTRVVGRTQPLPLEDKRSAVIALCMRSGSAESVAQQVGVSRQSLYAWKNQLRGHDTSAPMKRQKDQPESLERAELERQLEAPRQYIRRLQIEQDLLKKANELLKKGSGHRPATPDEPGEDPAG